MSGTANIMVPHHGGGTLFVISVKAAGESRWIDDYSELYERQVEEVTRLTSEVWGAWQQFMRVAAVTLIS